MAVCVESRDVQKPVTAAGAPLGGVRAEISMRRSAQVSQRPYRGFWKERAGRCVNSPGHGRHLREVVDMVDVTQIVRLCVYCGWDADTVDHVLPRTWTGDAGRACAPTVPACRDCNSRIGDKFGPTLGERRQIVWESLERKHRKLLRNQSWDDDEIEEFGPRLRAELEAREALRRMVRYRLDNLARDDDDPLVDWFLHAAAYGDNFARRLLDRRDAEALAGRVGV